MKRFSIIAALLLVFLFVGSPNAGEVKASIVFHAMNSEYWEGVRNGAEEAAKNFPELDLSVNAPKQEITAEQQIQRIEDEIAAGAKAVIVAPVDEVQLMPSLVEIHKRGIPVVVMCQDMSWPDKATFVGPNDVMGGYMAAEYIVKRLGGVGKVAIISGASGHRSATYRTNGAREAFRMNRGMKLVGVRSAGWERSDAMMEMENLLTLEPDLDAVFCCNDEMALGALEAIRAAKSEAFVVGFDATPETIARIKSGEIAASIAQNAHNTGRFAVSAAYRLVSGKKVPPFFDTGIELVTVDNAEEFEK